MTYLTKKRRNSPLFVLEKQEPIRMSRFLYGIRDTHVSISVPHLCHANTNFLEISLTPMFCNNR